MQMPALIFWRTLRRGRNRARLERDRRLHDLVQFRFRFTLECPDHPIVLDTCQYQRGMDLLEQRTSWNGNRGVVGHFEKNVAIYIYSAQGNRILPRKLRAG